MKERKKKRSNKLKKCIENSILTYLELEKQYRLEKGNMKKKLMKSLKIFV